MRTLLIAVAFMAVGSAYADECLYITEAGDKLQFLDNGENELTLTLSGAEPEICIHLMADNGHPRIYCDEFSGLAGDFTYTTGNREALSFLGLEWRRKCFVPV